MSVLDNQFKTAHHDLHRHKSDSPSQDKELGDSAFDSYDNYYLVKNNFHFSRIVIPLNLRNSKSSNAHFDSNGTPICPLDGAKFQFLGKSGGKNRSTRFKWVCPKSLLIPKSSKRFCACENPCTHSSYGKCVYTYPDKNFRLYPGIPRDTLHWDNLYKHRVNVERTINLFKESCALADNKSFKSVSLKADIFLSGIIQLIGVILADKLHKPRFVKSVRKLIA